MTVIGVLCWGLVAGWVVNLVADTLPKRQAMHTSPLWFLAQQSRPALAGSRTGAQTPRRQRYLGVWVAAILLGGLVFWQLGWTPKALLVAVEAWFFLAIAVIDLEHRIVPNRMLLVAAPIVLVANLLLGELAFASLLLGAVAGFGFFLVLALLAPGGMGMGDVKLAGLIGLTTGLASVVPALFIGILAGGVASVVILLTNRLRSPAERKQTMAYAPYLVVGVWVTLLKGIQFF
ncbi:MAG: prepilin peptidase [Caldilineaceae bacterium]|nr:prepilin peptidase [Caldilineaceae bacterium]